MYNKPLSWSINSKNNKIFIFFILFSVFLTFETWIFGPYSYIPLHDTGDGQVPVFYTLIQQFKTHGFSSTWYPYHLAGNDQKATYSIFHLITPFFYFFPLWLAFGSVLFLQHLLGGLSMFYFCKSRFKMSTMPSIIAGIAYTSPIIIMFGPEAHQEWWMNNYFEYRL